GPAPEVQQPGQLRSEFCSLCPAALVARAPDERGAHVVGDPVESLAPGVVWLGTAAVKGRGGRAAPPFVAGLGLVQLTGELELLDAVLADRFHPPGSGRPAPPAAHQPPP